MHELISHRNRPFVVLSCAMSLDGHIDDNTARRLVLSSPADLDRVDEERARADAVLVGAGTVRADNPRLEVRSLRRRDARRRRQAPPTPLKVVLGGRGRFRADAAVFRDPAGVIVYANDDAVDETRRRLGDVPVIAAGSPTNLVTVLSDLATRGVNRLLVEGGSAVHTRFLTAGLMDELQLVTAPVFVGADSAPRFVGAGTFPNNSGQPLVLAELRPIGDLVYARYSNHSVM